MKAINLFGVSSRVATAVKSTSLALLCLALFSLTAFGQQATTGSIALTVTDPSNAVVAGATVTVTNMETGATRTGETNTSGTVEIQTLTPANYTVTVEAKGFKKSVSHDIIISVSQTTTVTIPLEIGVPGETVTVTANQDVINTTSPTVTNVINTRQVVDLPLVDRNPVALAGLQAGIQVDGTNVRGASVSGLRQTAVNLTQDGINAMDNFVKTSSFFAITTPSLNSTDEFSVTTSTVGADSGRGGAQVNLVTKGGTNEYHGHAFLQIINNWTDSNVWFNQAIKAPKPILRQHYDGFDIGGPMYFPRFGEGGRSVYSGKDKAFFFFSYERFVQSDSRSRNRTVLTQSALNGQFTYTPTCTATNPCPAGITSGVARTVNLLTLPGVPFNALNPLMTAHLAQIPLPNNSTCAGSDGAGNISCFQFNADQLTSNDKYVFRYDHQLFKNRSFGSHKLEFVFSRVLTRTFPDVTTNGLEAPFPGGVNGFQASTRNLITPAVVSTFGNNVTNVFRFGRQWAPVDFNRDKEQTVPFISLPNPFTNYDNTFLPQPRNTIVDQVTDTLSWVKGNHLLKMGMDWQNVLGISRNDAGIVQLNQLGTNNANQSGITTGGVTTNLPGASTAQLNNATAVYTTIVGLMSSANQTLNVSSPTSGFIPGYTRLRQVDEKDLALFIQDQWRMKSNFTFSYGVRWDYMGVPTVPNGLAIQPTNFDAIWGVSGPNNLFKPTAAPGSNTQAFATLDFVSGKTGKGLYKNDWNNFAPFVGFAWSPSFKTGFLHTVFGDDGTSSIRAGYSMSFLHDGVTTFTNLLGTGNTNPGLIQTANTSAQANPVNSANITGQLTAAGIPLNFPTFKMPITDRENFLVNTASGLWTADPNLKAPYVHQWNFGIEKEIFKNTAFEARYVGNWAPNTWRALNINEVNIFENGFLTEFKNAQINRAARGGSSFAPGCAGCVALPLFDRFFGQPGTGGALVAAASAYTSTTFLNNLRDNNVGAMANTIAFNSTYKANRENAALGLAGNFFVANPNAALVNILTNDSYSNYNAMELELRKRFSGGLQFQADYTWSKAMGDATDAQGNNQSDLVSRLTLRNKQGDYRRSPQDQTQRFVANGIYDLPFGHGRRWMSDANGFVERLVGGFSMGAIVTWSTGTPFYVSSGRSTFNQSTANNGAQLVGITYEEFKKNIGLFKTPTGVFFVNPNLLDITLGTTGSTTGQATSATLKAGLMAAPAPGTFGNFPINGLSGPSYFDWDMSVTKRIRITERVKFELKGTAINILNHPSFNYGTVSFDSTSFGRITSVKSSSRQMNIIAQLTF
jgi:hypothetical protein